MGVRSKRPAIRALFLWAFASLASSTPALAEDPPPADPPPVTCPTGEFPDQFGECQKACKEPYLGGFSFTSGEQIPTRICFAGGVTVNNQPQGGHPACWHYVGTMKGEGWESGGTKYLDYSVYTNPGEICTEPGKKECDKLGCEKVEGGVPPGTFTETGAVTPQFGGQVMTYVPEAPYINGFDQYGTPGGTVASEPAAPEYCKQQGWSDLQLCNQSSQDVWYLQPSGTKPQQANDKSSTYLRAPTDVNCSTWISTDAYGNKTVGSSGTCNGPFYTPYNPSNHSWKCSMAKGQEYSGPLREGYNAAATSPSTACLLAYKEGVLRPIAGSQPNPEFPGAAKWYHMEEFVACEYELSKPSGVAGYKYKGTGASCSVVGAVGDSGATTDANTKYIPGWDDVACLNGVPDPSVWSAKCTGQKVVNGEVINDHYFGGRVAPFARFANGQVEIVQDLTGVYPTPGGYSHNSTILGGNPAIGTVNNSAGGTPGGGGSISIPALELSAEMPSQQFESWYTPEYPDGPVGVWNTRSEALQDMAMVQWVKGFELTGGASFNPSWTLDFSQMGFGAFEVSIPAEVMLVLRYLILISAAFAVRKIVFGG